MRPGQPVQAGQRDRSAVEDLVHLLLEPLAGRRIPGQEVDGVGQGAGRRIDGAEHQGVHLVADLRIVGEPPVDDTLFMCTDEVGDDVLARVIRIAGSFDRPVGLFVERLDLLGGPDVVRQRQPLQGQAEGNQRQEHVALHRVQDGFPQLGLDLEVDADHGVEQGAPGVPLRLVLEVDLAVRRQALAEGEGVVGDRLPVGGHALRRERRAHHLLEFRVGLEAGRRQAGRRNQVVRGLRVVRLEVRLLLDEDFVNQFGAEDRHALPGGDLEEDDVAVFRVEFIHELGVAGESLADVVQLASLGAGRQGRGSAAGADHRHETKLAET